MSGEPIEPNLVGRTMILQKLTDSLDRGETTLLFGPVDVGKSSVLRMLERGAKNRSLPCALVPATRGVSDVWDGIRLSYPDVDDDDATRVVRARLRAAIDERPGWLLLDHLTASGLALKATLRSLRGSGLGVLVAIDTENAHDHSSARSLRLTHREKPLPRLHANSLHAILAKRIAERRLPFSLDGDSARELVAAAEGLPGRIARFVDALTREEAWHDGSPRTSWLKIEATIAALESYRARSKA